MIVFVGVYRTAKLGKNCQKALTCLCKYAGVGKKSSDTYTPLSLSVLENGASNRGLAITNAWRVASSNKDQET